MKPSPFGYRLAESLQHALELHSESAGDAIWLAGGHSVVPSLALRLQAPAVLVATAGNTIGGAISYAMGAGAEAAWHRWRARQAAGHDEPPAPPAGAATNPGIPPRTDAAGPANAPSPGGRWHALTTRWFHRFGPPALLLSWLPGVGDPLCAVAGWLRLSFWPCVAYMAIGKFLRYTIMTVALLHAWPRVSGWL